MTHEPHQPPPPLHSYEFFAPDWTATTETPTLIPSAKRMATTPPAPDRVVMRQGIFATKPDEIDEDWDTSDLDWEAIKSLRAQASNLLREENQTRTTPMSEEEEREIGDHIIDQLISNWIADQTRAGSSPDELNVARTTKALRDALFGMGRLQPLIDSEYIENIEIHGCDWTLIQLTDGTLVHGPSIADSDEELIEDVKYWSERAKAPRPFSPANPAMNLPLGIRARLAAIAWVTLRPIITIRIHGLVKVNFADLEALNTLTPLMSNFLHAAVNAGFSIVVAGDQGAGKTTLCRALCAALPPSERIITFETDRELHLEQMPDKHPRVFGIEARQGFGEFRSDGREAGVYTVSDGLRDSLRHNGDRLLVGEVRGSEIIAMIEAMQSGTGSISTTHARSARDAYQKLITLALKQEGVSETYARRAVAGAVDYIVFIRKIPASETSSRARKVTEIVALDINSDGEVQFTDIFRPHKTGQVLPYMPPPMEYDIEELVQAGFDRDAFMLEARQS
jgi:secretion system protein